MSDNPFSDVLDGTVNGLSAGASIADITSNVAQSAGLSSVPNSNSLTGAASATATSERLYHVRPRYAPEGSSYSTSSRTVGDWAYIKLLTSKTQKDQYVSGNTSRQITNQNLIGSGSIVAGMATAGESQTYGYDRFLITDVGCQLNEKTQVTEVFGDNEVVYYFGRQPMVFNIGGMLIDSPDNSWFTDWLQMYSDFLRGTQLAQNYEMLQLVLPSMTIIGTITGFSWSQNSQRDTDIPFSFQFIAKSIVPTPTTNAGVPNSNAINSVDFSQVAQFTSQAGINALANSSTLNTLSNKISNLSQVIQNPLSTISDKASALSGLGSSTSGIVGSIASAASDTLSSFQSTVNGWDSARASFFDSIQQSSLFQSVTSTLAGVRLNLFSPIYGIMSSLNKLVSNAFNSVTGLLNTVITPVRSILRDITNISNQAVALVGLVNSSVTGLAGAINGTFNAISTDFNTAIKSIGKAAGSIATAPITIAQSIGNMFSNSVLSYNAPFLASSSKVSFSRPILNVSGQQVIVPKYQLVTGIAKYSITNPTL